MPQEGKGARSAIRLPDLHALIVAARGQQMTIARPGEAIHPVRMPFIGEDWRATTGGFPYLDCLILACGGNQLTIRRPDNRRDLFRMPPVDDAARTSGSVEDLNKRIVTGRSNEFAIRRPCQSINTRQMPCKDENVLVIDGGLRRWRACVRRDNLRRSVSKSLRKEIPAARSTERSKAYQANGEDTPRH